MTPKTHRPSSRKTTREAQWPGFTAGSVADLAYAVTALQGQS